MAAGESRERERETASSLTRVSPTTTTTTTAASAAVMLLGQTVLEMERYLKDEPKVVRMYGCKDIPTGSILKELKAVQSGAVVAQDVAVASKWQQTVRHMEELEEKVLQMEEYLKPVFKSKLSRRAHKCQYEVRPLSLSRRLHQPVSPVAGL